MSGSGRLMKDPLQNKTDKNFNVWLPISYCRRQSTGEVLSMDSSSNLTDYWVSGKGSLLICQRGISDPLRGERLTKLSASRVATLDSASESSSSLSIL